MALDFSETNGRFPISSRVQLTQVRTSRGPVLVLSFLTHSFLLQQDVLVCTVYVKALGLPHGISIIESTVDMCLGNSKDAKNTNTNYFYNGDRPEKVVYYARFV